MIEELEKYAKENRIPIMQKDGIEYLCNYIKNNNIKNILEIGSAIGYSAIKMAQIDPNIKITTIEKDKERYNIAVQNIKKFNLENRIDLILNDALNIDINKKYDLLFIDASKGHNIDFFNKFKNNLLGNGVIITDNLSFHGLVENEELAITKNQKGLVKKIKKYIDFLDTNREFNTKYVSVGDKISISIRKEVKDNYGKKEK